jgi:hypothetical protein
MRRSRAYQEKMLAQTALVAGASLNCSDGSEDLSHAAQPGYLRLTVVNMMPVVLAVTILTGMAYVLI